MTRLEPFALIAIFTAGIAATATAASVSLYRSVREVTAEEIAAGAPLGGFVNDFYIDADSDLLSFSNIQVDAPLYQNSFGRDDAQPDASLSGLSSAVTADSYITTPGPTLTLGGGFTGTGDRLWGDLTNDGPQSNFHFARLTTSQPGAFSGRVALRGYSEPVYVPFSFDLPASPAGMALANAAPKYTANYSLDPPPAPITPPPTPYHPPGEDPLQRSGPNQPPTPSGPPLPLPLPAPTTPKPPAPATPHHSDQISANSITPESRLVTSQEVAGGAPAGAVVNDFRLTTDADVLCVCNVDITSPLYQHALGKDDGAWPQELIDTQPAVGADSFIQAPGSTVVLGGGFSGGKDSLWGDLSNDGPQTDFLFSRLTTTETGAFTGAISLRTTATSDGYIMVPFTMSLPGTADDLLALGATTHQDFKQYAPLPPPPTPVVPTPPAPEPAPTPGEDPLQRPGSDPNSPQIDPPPDQRQPTDNPNEPPTIPIDDPPLILTIDPAMRPGLKAFPITGVGRPFIWSRWDPSMAPGGIIDLELPYADIDVTAVLDGGTLIYATSLNSTSNDSSAIQWAIQNGPITFMAYDAADAQLAPQPNSGVPEPSHAPLLLPLLISARVLRQRLP
jgi:hypothetical protein